jgi:modification methylase
MKTNHKIIFGNSAKMTDLSDNSIDLMITSPPYPMIEMWDSLFESLNEKINYSLEKGDVSQAFNLMHLELEKTWAEVARVLKSGGIACVNIGDATRKIGDTFQLFSNHSKIIAFFIENGFHAMPEILWRKQSNKPNKFMGSGMLPPNAYVTLEHEYILLFRKNNKRNFTEKENIIRYQSAYFWEERNNWFSDVWFDLKGINQKLNHDKLRERSAAYPFELVYRLINMFSVYGDNILDPFWGIGTTTLAAMSLARNSIGYEIDSKFMDIFRGYVNEIDRINSDKLKMRIDTHVNFIRERENKGKDVKFKAKNYDFDVMASQEREIKFFDIDDVKYISNNEYNIYYREYQPKIQKTIDCYSHNCDSIKSVS